MSDNGDSEAVTDTLKYYEGQAGEIFLRAQNGLSLIEGAVTKIDQNAAIIKDVASSGE